MFGQLGKRKCLASLIETSNMAAAHCWVSIGLPALSMVLAELPAAAGLAGCAGPNTRRVHPCPETLPPTTTLMPGPRRLAPARYSPGWLIKLCRECAHHAQAMCASGTCHNQGAGCHAEAAHEQSSADPPHRHAGVPSRQATVCMPPDAQEHAAHGHTALCSPAPCPGAGAS